MSATTLADAYAQVYEALSGQTVPVYSALSRLATPTGAAYVVGPPATEAVLQAGYCLAHEYRVPVTVYPGGDDLTTLVDDADTCIGLLAAANLTTLDATPATRSVFDDPATSVVAYELTVRV